MKKQAYTIIALLVLTVSLAAAAQAQTSGRSELRASIPFQFHVGDTTMPAGEYTVHQINPASDHCALQLRSKDGRSSAMIQMINVMGKAGERARLVFHRYGEQYYFSQAWTAGNETGWQAPRSKAERSRPRLARGEPATETVALTTR
ncbi:MAG TPA: hypothetical protein VKD91_17200 [Pyrinomonadaceae bacterium]|nr:hypothetical protein [Pyrinomonadaceae bacterium]